MPPTQQSDYQTAMLASSETNRLVVWWLLMMALLVAIMVVIGGVTRLTGSGLSMTEWRPLMGTLPPMSEAEWARVFALYKASPEYSAINYGMDLAGFKTIFFWEYFHRLWGRFLGLAFALPLLGFVIARRVPKGYGLRLFALLILGGMQGVIGWWMVKSGLSEEASVSQYRLATHLGMALFIFALLLWTALDIRDGRAHAPKGHAAGTLGIVALTIIAGAMVAGMDAGLLYNEYPLMGTGLVPVEYGEAGLLDPFENPASAQFHHRWIAVLAVGAVVTLALRAARTLPPRIKLPAYFSMAVVGGQFLLGIITLLHGVPVTLGGMHQGGAVLLLGTVIWLSHRMQSANRPLA